MKNLFSSAIAYIGSLLNTLQVKRFVAVCLVGFVLLTTNAGYAHSNNTLANEVQKEAHEIDSVRPKTTNEWYKEARETKDDAGERLDNIAEEAGQAFKEFGGLYPDTAKTSARALDEQTSQPGRTLLK